MHARELHTVKVNKGRRTYFFDIAKSDGGHYIRMSCSEKKRAGFEHQRIFIFEEDLSGFMAAFQKSADELKRRASADRDPEILRT
jgi:hypothetical protein